MDKNVEAQQIANKYLETEISNFQVQIQSDSVSFISATKAGFLVELDMLEECLDGRDYSHIDNIINDLLPSDFKFNTDSIAYKTLRYKFFQARITAAQEMIKICEGPYSYNFIGENIDLDISLAKFFAKEPAVNKWKRDKQKKTQILINELAAEILTKYPNTGLTDLASEISEMDRLKNFENPVDFETIRKDYLDDFK